MSPSSNMNSRQQRPNYSRLKGKCVPTCTVDPSVVPFAHRTSWLAHGDGHPHQRQHAKIAPRSQNAVAPTTTHARVPSTTTSQRIPRQLVPKNSTISTSPQISLHIRPGYSVPPSTHLLSKPSDRPI